MRLCLIPGITKYALSKLNNIYHSLTLITPNYNTLSTCGRHQFVSYFNKSSAGCLSLVVTNCDRSLFDCALAQPSNPTVDCGCCWLLRTHTKSGRGIELDGDYFDSNRGTWARITCRLLGNYYSQTHWFPNRDNEQQCTDYIKPVSLRVCPGGNHREFLFENIKMQFPKLQVNIIIHPI